MHQSIIDYNNMLPDNMQQIANLLSSTILSNLPEAENKIWHSHPVWFINQNPIVGYSLEKKGCRLMFWSGKSFNEANLNIIGKKFEDASIFYNSLNEVDTSELKKWLQKSKTIQWDYKNIVKRKGVLLPLF